MWEIFVDAALVSHVPPIMYPAEWRVLFGEDTDLIDGWKWVRSELDRVEADTFVIVDSHWFTTVEHVLTPPPDNVHVVRIDHRTHNIAIDFHSAPPPRTMAPSDHPREHE